MLCNRTLSLTLIYFILSTSMAQAYFDPGTGALAVQFLVGIIAMVALFWRRIFAGIARIFSRKADETAEKSDSDRREQPWEKPE